MRPSIFAQLSAAFLLAATLAWAQTPTPAKHTFEVVSIRPNKSGNQGMNWGTTPDGYRTVGQSIWQTIMIAYFPQGMSYWNDRLQGAPSWIGDLYDINARVSEADLHQWQKQGVGMDKIPLLQEMLQTMLADRCKLVVHRVPSSILGLALTTGKHGARLTLSRPNATLPAGIKFPDGGILVAYNRGEPARLRFYNATIADLLQNLNMMSYGHPVVDRTGLSARYDIVLSAVVDPQHPEWAGSSRYGLEEGWDLDALGLHLQPIKIPIDDLVIDHIEKPSEN